MILKIDLNIVFEQILTSLLFVLSIRESWKYVMFLSNLSKVF